MIQEDQKNRIMNQIIRILIFFCVNCVKFKLVLCRTNIKNAYSETEEVNKEC